MCKEGSLSKRKLSNSKLHVIIPSIGHLKYANAVFFGDRHRCTFVQFCLSSPLKSISLEGENRIKPFENV